MYDSFFLLSTKGVNKEWNKKENLKGKIKGA